MVKEIHISLTDRQKSILKAVIEHFQSTGMPVSSKWLSEEGGFSESAATLRAELSNLEAMGYLDHLHTSGGRLPTDDGYRYYIDDCLKEDYINDPILESFISSIYDQYAGKPFEFSRALGIFLSKRLSMPVISSVDDGIYCWKGGLSFMVNYREMFDSEAIMPIISFIDQFEYHFAPFIEKIAFGKNISVLIGSDNEAFGLNSVSVIVSNYTLPSNRNGKLVIVGPIRIEYQKVLPYLNNIIYQLNKLT